MTDRRLASRSPHLLTLILATATSALAMNIFLPSLPAISRHFEADYGVAQLMLSVYLAATAVFQLILGPASDRFGRRPVMLASLAIYTVATVAALYAPTIHLLLLCRVFQAFAIGGVVLSRAIVRDTVGPDAAASRMAYITMGMAVVPMIGPVIGGILDEMFGWQSTFLVTLGYGVVALIVVYFDLNETNNARSSSFTAQFATYPQLLRSRRFWAYSLTAAFTSGAFFALLGGGPYVATVMLGLSPSGYGLYFALISLGYMSGNFLTGRFSRRFGMNRMMLAGGACGLVGSALGIVAFLLGFSHPLSLFGPALLVGMGNGMCLPNANAGIVSVKPHLAGSASGLGGAMQIGGGAIMSVVAGAFLSPVSGPYPLLAVMLVTSVAAIACTLYGIHVDRTSEPIGS